MKNPVTARRLTDAISNAGISQQELSEKSGVSKSSISQYCNGTHIPSDSSAGKMAKVLHVSPVWLMGFDVPEKLPNAKDETDPDIMVIEKLRDTKPDRFRMYVELMKGEFKK